MGLPTGKGLWIWQILTVQQLYGEAHLQMDGIKTAVRQLGLGHVVFKGATNLGRYNLRRPNPSIPIALYDDLIPALVSALHEEGVEAWLYSGVTEGSIDRPEVSARLHVQRAKSFGCDGLIANAEGSYWQDRPDRYSAAERYASTVKDEAGYMPVGLSTYRFIKTSQPRFPAQQFMRHLDFVKPQVYPVLRHGQEWINQLDKSAAEWRQVTDKPIVPDGAAYTEQRPQYRHPDGTLWLPTLEDLTLFDAACRQRGYSGYTLWDWYSAGRYNLLPLIAGLSAYNGPAPTPEPITLEQRVESLERRVTDLENHPGVSIPALPINTASPTSQKKFTFNLSGNHGGPIDAHSTPGGNKEGSFGKHQQVVDTGKRHQGNDWMLVRGTLSNGKSGEFWISKDQATLVEV